MNNQLNLSITNASNPNAWFSITAYMLSIPAVYGWEPVCDFEACNYFKVIDESFNYEGAKKACKLLGADLASIKNIEEQALVGKLLSGSHAWIGLKWSESSGNFTWVDGTESNFTAWMRGEPTFITKNLTKEKCVLAWSKNTGKWNDIDCNLSRNTYRNVTTENLAVCKKSIAVSTLDTSFLPQSPTSVSQILTSGTNAGNPREIICRH